MRRNLFLKAIGLALGVSMAVIGCSKLESDKDQQSYSVGFALGQQLSKVRDDINPDVVARGLKDGIKSDGKTEMKLDADLMAKRLGELQQKQREREVLTAAETLKKSEAYIQGIAEKEGVKVIEKGIIVEIKKAGTGSSRAMKPDDELTLKYTAKRTDGGIIDQTSNSNGFKVRFKDLLLPGLKKVVQLMPIGSEWTVHLAPDQAYGTATRPGVPSQSAIVYDITLVSVTSAAKPQVGPMHVGPMRPKHP